MCALLLSPAQTLIYVIIFCTKNFSSPKKTYIYILKKQKEGKQEEKGRGNNDPKYL